MLIPSYDANINAGITTNSKSKISELLRKSFLPVLGEKIRQSHLFSKEVYPVC
jgi:hypothetical protein